MQTQGYLHLDNDTVRYEHNNQTLAKIPLLHISAIVVHSNVLISPALLRYCSQHGLAVTWLDYNGNFVGSLRLPTSGNVLLRLEQYRSHCCAERSLALAQSFVSAKVNNSRFTLMRRARDANPEEANLIREQQTLIEQIQRQISKASDLDQLRGYEGLAARHHFDAFPYMISSEFKEDFCFNGRSKRPPRDRFNAMLSFGYTLATNECRTALEGIGLDPQIGFLHQVRPGRPALALDLVEELRAPLVDRLVFSLINRKQIQPSHFDVQPGGAVLLNDQGRKLFIQAYQKRKEQNVPHPLFQNTIPFGLVAHVQARILARFLRGDIPQYIPFVYK
jgi:CRISPR-associated protein Cas1